MTQIVYGTKLSTRQNVIYHCCMPISNFEIIVNGQKNQETTSSCNIDINKVSLKILTLLNVLFLCKSA